MKSKEELKSFFENGDIPKQDDFWEWQDSYWHKNEKLPLENIDYDFSNKADLIDGKIPATQLPSYVDDILEFDSLEDLPNPGERGKIYVITSTNTQLRWSGSEYVPIISGHNVMITDSPQDVFPNGTKTFWTDDHNNSLHIKNTNSEGAGITFDSNGIGQIVYNDDEFRFTNSSGTDSIPIVSDGFIKSDSSNDYVLTGGGGHKAISDFVLDTDLSNYVTINTPQTIESRKTFNGAIDNSYSGAAIMANGNQPLGLYPTIGFHQPGNYAGTLSYRNDGRFHFMNEDAGVYRTIATDGVHKAGSSDSYVLTGGGGHKPISDFVDLTSGQDITGYKTFFSYLGGDIANNRLWVRSSDGSNPGISFVRDGVDNGQIIYNGEVFAFLNTNSSGYVSVVADGFNKAGSDDNYFLTGGGNHIATSSKANALENGTGIGFSGSSYPTNDGSQYPYIYHSNPGSNTSYVALATQGYVSTNYIPKTHPVYNITQAYIDGWETYLGYWDNRQISPSSTAPHNLQFGFASYFNNNTAPYADYLHFGGYSDSSGGNQNLIMFHKNGFGIRQYQGSSQSVSPYSQYVDYWHSGNFNPDNKVNKSGDTMTGTLSLGNGANLRINGIDSNWIQSYRETTGNVGIVAGFEYAHYATRWKVGNKRGGSTDSLGYCFEFSDDDGANYTEKVRIQPDGNIATESFGSANLWNYAYQQVSNKVNKSGDTMTGDLHALNITAQNAADTLTYDNLVNYGSPLRINANASLGIYLQANGTDILYVGPSFISSYRDLHMESNTVIYTSSSNSYQWERAYTDGLVNRNEGFSSNIDANNLPNNQTGIISLELGNGTGNTNFPKNDAYGNFMKMTGRAFTSEFFHENNGSLYHRNWYYSGGGNPSNYPFRKIWDDINLEDYHQYGLGRTVEASTNYDINTIANTSILGINDNTVNRPLSYGSVWTHRKNTSEFTQIAVDLFSGDLLTRGWSNGTGDTGWRNFWHNGNFNPNNKVNKSGDTMTGSLTVPSITLTNGFINSSTLNGSQIFAALTDTMYFGNTSVANVYYQTLTNHIWQVGGNTIAYINSGGLAVTGALSLNGQDVATQPWVNANYTPISHVGSGGTAHANATTSTAGFMSSADKTKLDNINTSNFVTINTTQTVTGSKNFADGSQVQFLGGDGNHIIPQRIPGGSGTIVSGHDYTHYNTRWRVGNVRGGSTDSTALGFFFSSDNGSSFSNRVSIDSANGQINTAIHGNSAEWNDIAQNGVRSGNNGFTTLQNYREIDDNTFDIDDVTVEKFNIVFNASANGRVVIHSLPNGQTYHLHNFSASNILRVDVEGYGNVDNIEPGETKVYMAHNSGHLRRISSSNTYSII